jgi:hypothetical protein
VAPLDLSRVQKRELARRGYGWIQTIKRLNKAAEALEGEDAASKHGAVINDVHMLSLALKHLDSCLRHLSESGETIEGAAEFRAAWKAMSDLRDALEHEEEYIAGRGKRPCLFSRRWVANDYHEEHFLMWGNEGIESVSFMGRTYKVRPAIAAALNLEVPLLDFCDPPSTHS